MTDRVKTIGLGVLFLMAGAAVFAFNPEQVSVFPPCLFHRLTGWWCPGCGTTRALHQLLHGNLTAALRFNPVAICLLPLVGYLIVCGDQGVVKPGWIWMLLGVAVAFGVLRNIPAYPFTLLAP